MATRLPYRAVFISDLHLGSSACRAADIAAFLKHVECRTLYLVGDVIDMWRLRSRWYWPEEHNRVVHRILKIAKRGTRVVLIPGNHDEHARQYAGLNFGGVELVRDAVHVTADGRRLLVTHGDEVDVVIRHARLLSVLGGVAYERLVMVSRWHNRVQRLLGRPEWSLSQYVKLRVKSACKHIARFEEALEGEARRRGLNGVVCGHIHKAEIRRGDAVDYFNCGDWVESCTALVEHDDGAMRIVHGPSVVEQLEPDLAADEPIAEIDRTLPLFGA